MAREVYEPNAIKKMSALSRLTSALKDSLNILDDSPFSRGRPVFKLTVPQDQSAEFIGKRRSNNYQAGTLASKFYSSGDDIADSETPQSAEEWSRDNDPDYDPQDPKWSDY